MKPQKYLTLLLYFFLFNNRLFSQILGPDTVCQGTVSLFSVTQTGNKQWQLNGSVVQGQTGSNYSSLINVLGGNSITCIISNGVTSTTFTKQIVVIPNPIPEIVPVDVNGCYSIGGRKNENEQIRTGYLNGCNQKVCKGKVYTYYVKGVATSSFVWTIPSAATIVSSSTNNDTVRIIWNTVGQFSLAVKEENTIGCLGTDMICIEVIPNPIACFTTLPLANSANEVHVCQNAPITFNAGCSVIAGNSILQFSNWIFGDGTFATDQYYITHSYATAGTYHVSFVLESNCHCTDTVTITVVVDPGNGPDIECISTVCFGDTSTYHTSDLCTNLLWGTRDGTPVNALTTDSLRVIWGDGSNGFGQLVLQDNCSGHCNIPTVVEVPILPQHATINGDEYVCSGQTAVYYVPFIPSTVYQWSVIGGVGTSIVQPNYYQVTWLGGGGSTHTVSVDYTNPFLKCSGDASKTVHVTPYLNLAGKSKYCANEVISFFAFENDSTIKVPCKWKLYSMPSKTVLATSSILSTYTPTGLTAGSYMIEADVTPTSYCNTPISAEFAVVAQPPVLTGPIVGDDHVCVGIPYTYSTASSNPNYFVEWKATGGLPQSATGNSASISWSLPTSLTQIQARQVMFDEPRCSSSWIAKPIYPLNFNLSVTGPTSVCSDQSVNYTSTMTDADWYEWRIQPTSAGTITPASSGTLATILWNNVSSSTSATVWLVVEKCGIRDSFSVPVTINSAPTITINAPALICKGSSETFATTITGSSYSWTFQKINSSLSPITSSGNPTVVSFPEEGSWTAHLNVLQPGGCPLPADAYLTVNVMPAPVAALTSADPSYQCGTGWANTLTVTLQNMNSSTFTYSFTGPSGSIAAISGHPNQVSVSQYGAYQATVTNSLGCSSTTNSVIIHPCASGGCSPLATVTTSTTNNCGTVTYNASVSNGTFTGWTFRDPITGATATSTSLQATFSYSHAGYYEASASAIDANGCVYTKYEYVTVPLVVDFISRFACDVNNAFSTQLIDISDYLPSITSWNWEVKKAGVAFTTSTPNAQTNSFTGHQGDALTVKLTVGDMNGAQCALTKNIQVPAAITAAFNVPDTVCEGNPVQFSWTGTGDAVGFEWTYEDESNSISKVNPSFHQFFVGATPNLTPPSVTLTIIDRYGCSADFVKNIRVVKNRLGFIGLTPNPVIGCLGDLDTIHITQSCINCLGNMTKPITFTWNRGVNTTDSILFPLSNGVYIVTVTDRFGCMAHSGNATVFYHTPPPAVITGDTAICEGTIPNLTLFAGHQYQYRWMIRYSGGAQFFDITYANNSYQLNMNVSGQEENAEVFGIVVDPVTGCSDTSVVRRLHIFPRPANPTITINPTLPCLSGGRVITLTAHAPIPGVFQWTNGYVGDSIKVMQAGLYAVQIVDANGCSSNKQTIGISPGPDFSQLIYGCYEFCIGTSVTIPGPTNANGYIFQWMKDGVVITNPYALLSGNVVNLPVNSSGVYRLILTSPEGCKDTSKPIDINFIPCPTETDCMIASAECSSCHWDSIEGVRYYEYILPVTYTGSPADTLLNVQVFINGGIVAAQYWNESRPNAPYVSIHPGSSNNVIHLVFIDVAPYDNQITVVFRTEHCIYTKVISIHCGNAGITNGKIAASTTLDPSTKKAQKEIRKKDRARIVKTKNRHSHE